MYPLSYWKVIETAKYFFPEKPGSKRIAQMQKHALEMSRCQNMIKAVITLPHKLLIEQINLKVDGGSKH
jgi:hypothetical protein